MGAYCSTRAANGGHTRKGVTYDAHGHVTQCVFCDIASAKDHAEYREMESDGIVAKFRSRAFDAKEHWLIVPVQHIRDIRDPALSTEMLDHMVSVGRQCGDILAFHVPPSNSIDHIHLHAFKAPFTNCLKHIKHVPGKWKFWTVGPDDVRTKLRSQGALTKSLL